MVRISGVDLDNKKRLDIALTRIYGIGRVNVKKVLEKANLPFERRTNTLTDDEVNRLSKVIEKEFMVEGDLRRNIGDSIKRLMDIKAYRGMRHAHKLPSRGQRTRTNARTKRGKRMTVGALKKEDRAKTDTASSESK